MPRDPFPSRVAAGILRLMLAAGLFASCTGGDDASRGVQPSTEIETSTLGPPDGELRTDQALELTNAVAAIATSTGIHDDGPTHGHVVIVSRDGSTAILPTQGTWFARVAFDGRQVLAQDRTSDYAIGPNPFAIKREFATSQHGILLVEGEGQYSAWFNSGIPPGQSDWRVDVSRGGPALTADHYPLMGIHLLGRCAGRTLGLAVSPDAVHIEGFRAGTHTPLGAAWRGEPPAGMSKPMPCNGDELVAVVNQGGDPAPDRHP